MRPLRPTLLAAVLCSAALFGCANKPEEAPVVQDQLPQVHYGVMPPRAAPTEADQAAASADAAAAVQQDAIVPLSPQQKVSLFRRFEQFLNQRGLPK